MTSRTKGWLLIVGLGIVPPFCIASCGLLTIQALPSARLGLVGSLDELMDHSVTLTASLPHNYGLTPSEIRGGFPALNEKPNELKVALGESFTLRFPDRVVYCTTHFIWQPDPPPPARFVLRFSDSPDEEYVIYGPGDNNYFVQANGGVIPPETASWRLRLGPFTRGPDEAGLPKLWLLRVRFTRQSHTTTEPSLQLQSRSNGGDSTTLVASTVCTCSSSSACSSSPPGGGQGVDS
jgi:hypothetical protein